MKSVFRFLTLLLAAASIVLPVTAKAVTCELGAGVSVSCNGSSYDVSWSSTLSGCTATYTLERKCGSGPYILVASNLTTTTYTDNPSQGCLTCYTYRVTINCDCDCTDPCVITSQCTSCP